MARTSSAAIDDGRKLALMRCRSGCSAIFEPTKINVRRLRWCS
jgi:hypothetical protein